MAARDDPAAADAAVPGIGELHVAAALAAGMRAMAWKQAL